MHLTVSPTNSYAEALTPRPPNVNLVGKRPFKDHYITIRLGVGPSLS